MPVKTVAVDLKEAFLKKLHAKPGDRIELIVKENGKAIAKKKKNTIAHQTFGIWKGEMNGIKFMDRMRSRWTRSP